MRATKSLLVLMFALQAPAIELAPVASKPVNRIVTLPGEVESYLSVNLHARVPGYVERVLVDRGSVVKQGDLLVELNAPEMRAQIAEAESKIQVAEAEQLQAEAQLAATQSTFDRLKKAAETPGAVAGNEVVIAAKQVDAATAAVNSRRQAARAAVASTEALKELEGYLKITAPFDGVVTERFVHPGALVGPNSTNSLLTLEQLSRLRLVVAVPEEYVGGIAKGATVTFQVPAYPEKLFTGTVARVSRVLDPKTRTMPVELDVANKDAALSPGMYPSVKWPVRRTASSLWVPKTSVVTTTERTFVIRDKSGTAEWVDVRKGAGDGDLIEVLGSLRAGDRVVKRANDEIREGTSLKTSK